MLASICLFFVFVLVVGFLVFLLVLIFSFQLVQPDPVLVVHKDCKGYLWAIIFDYYFHSSILLFSFMQVLPTLEHMGYLEPI
jgi:hypothetical protein